MKILDTNVVSELMREVPDGKVVRWLAAQTIESLGVSVITLAEIGRGLKRLPEGRRREGLERRFAEFIEKGFHGRVFAFDERAAGCYGEIAADQEAAGLHVDAVDFMIAAIAKDAGAALVTRNTADFEVCGIEVINPWE
jgi:predicted nucleic acid-binding protein